jgi:hypothetical protein
VELKARCAVVHREVVGGVSLVMFMHPKAPMPSHSLFCWADLDGWLVAMRYGRGSCLRLS